MPSLARIDHEGSDHGAVRPALLDFGDFPEIGFDRTIADEFDIVETDHAHLAEIQGRITRRDVHDGIANGFPDHATPPRLKSTMALVSGIRGRAGGDPKRIRGADAS